MKKTNIQSSGEIRGFPGELNSVNYFILLKYYEIYSLIVIINTYVCFKDFSILITPPMFGLIKIAPKHAFLKTNFEFHPTQIIKSQT